MDKTKEALERFFAEMKLLREEKKELDIVQISLFTSCVKRIANIQISFWENMLKEIRQEESWLEQNKEKLCKTPEKKVPLMHISDHLERNPLDHIRQNTE